MSVVDICVMISVTKELLSSTVGALSQFNGKHQIKLSLVLHLQDLLTHIRLPKVRFTAVDQCVCVCVCVPRLLW